MKRPHLTRVALSVVATALLITATPAPLGAQATGTIGQDDSRPPQTARPTGGSGGATVTINPPQITRGSELPGQDDVPAGEPRLREPDIIKVSATIEGTGGGPTQGGGSCSPGQVTVETQVTLPAIVAHMDPPRPFEGGQGGVVTVATWFWAEFLGNTTPSSSSSGSYTSCSSRVNALGRTVWSASEHTATIRLNSAPTGEVDWAFGDSDVRSACGDPGLPQRGLGGAQQATVQHTYCISSIRARHPVESGGYRVAVSANFTGHVSLDAGAGGGDQDVMTLDLGTDSGARYPVREVQAVLDE